MESENLQTIQEPSATGLSVLVNPSRPALDIVFVHGFTGHPERTWKREGSNGQFEHDDEGERPSKIRKLLGNKVRNVYWPRDLLPINVPNARILTYGYDTNIRYRAGSPINKSTVYDIAWNFLVSLEAVRRVEKSRPLLFIAHSLGGIIVKEALRRSRGCETHQSHLHSIYEFSSGIVFFGTPHGGADPRGLVLHILEQVIRGIGFNVNDQIVNALLPSAERLKELRDEFGPMARQRNWTIYSFQEQYGVIALGGKKVVDDTASCLNDPTIEVTQHIASDHMGMCRFGGPNDIEYAKVVGAVNRILEATKRLNPSGERMALDADQRQRFLDCLRFDQIDARHATIKTAHAKTCKWLLSNSEYQEWLNEDKISNHHGFLWIKGKPATGKSTIMKFAYANARKTMRDTITISFFFNARGEQLEKSALGMYRSLLFQLLEKLPDLPVTFESPPSSLLSDFDRWDVETVKNMFGRAVQSLGQRHLICFIDALDECEEDAVREMVAFFERLGQFAILSKIKLHVCFSSRHYPHITIEKGVSLVLEDQGGHEQDISNYLHTELKAGRSKLVEQIKDEILQRASGIFLWVLLVVQMLNKEFNCGRMYALRKRLDEIPNGLDELFQDILLRDGQNIDELILCLQWILYAKRPLKREELYFAVLSGVAPEALAAWSLEEITGQDMERFVLSSSKGLAETAKSKHQTVQFIHESVRDFLLKGNGLDKLRSNLSSNFWGFSHERLKQCCQTYMRIDVSECLTSGTSLPVASSQEAKNLRQLLAEKFPFLEYATRNVLYHADTASGYGILQTAFVEDFCLRDWINLDNLFERYQIRRHTSESSLLYFLAEQNLPNLIQIELQRVQNMDIKGERHGFPLNVALVNKNESAIKALLIPNTGARFNNNVPLDLYCSAGREHQESITFILQNRYDMVSQNDRTLLSWAAEAGHDAVVKLLLETGQVDVDSKDTYGRTPMSWAALGGHEAVVKLLLETGQVDVDSKDRSGRTPMLWAALGGHEAVVKLLLETGQVDVDSKDTSGRGPTSWAALGGHEVVVKLLLETGQVDVDSKDTYGRTPMSWAALGGHEVVVKLLLETGQVDVDSKDSTYGLRPMSWAAGRGHEAVVKLLLETGQVDVDSKDTYGQTPMSSAAGGGHEAVVKLLLETGQVDVDSKDTSGRTPMLWAALGGHEAVVKLLLETGQVDVDSKDTSGRRPTSWAALGGHEVVVKLLLETGQVDVDSKDRNGRTPMSWAAGEGHEAVVKLLLETGQVDVDSKDSTYGLRPMSWAAGRGHEAVVKLLLETGQVDVDSKDSKYGRTPMSSAAGGGHEAVVKLLLETGQVDVDSKDRSGRTPMLWAALGGHEAVVKLLLETGQVDVDSKDRNGRTPMSWAALGGHEAVVKLLLETGQVDVDSKDSKYGRTPMSWAGEGGHEAVVKLLLETGQVDVDSKDTSGRTPMSWAAERGHEAVVKLLLETGQVSIDLKENSANR